MYAGTELFELNSLILKHPLHTQPFYIKENTAWLYFIIYLSAVFILCFFTTYCGRGFISVTEHDVVAFTPRVLDHKTSCKLN